SGATRQSPKRRRVPVRTESDGAVRLTPLEPAFPFRIPALHDDLGLCIELDGMTTLSMQVAKEALLPAAEWIEGHRRCHADVDADVADDRLTAKTTGRRPTRREQARHVALRATIDYANGIVERLDVNQAEHGAEHFGPGHPAGGV